MKRYGSFTAVNRIAFDVRRGEIFAFPGPNGAGKTTTVGALQCPKTLTSGSVKILGDDGRGDESKVNG